jgi:hypothetical protein
MIYAGTDFFIRESLRIRNYISDELQVVQALPNNVCRYVYKRNPTLLTMHFNEQ